MDALYGPLSALVPEEVRAPWLRRHGVDAPAWSALLGVLELFAGGLLLVDDFVRRVPLIVDAQATVTAAALEARQLTDPDGLAAVGWSGYWAWLVWITSPYALLLVMVTVVGALRLLAFGLTREAIAEPLVWLGWRAWRLLVAAPAAAGRRAAVYGRADRPDRVQREPDGGWLVLTARPRPEWNERVTIQIGDGFYRLAEVGERQEGPWRWHAYRLREEDPSAVIRALVAYQPPADAKRPPTPRSRGPG